MIRFRNLLICIGVVGCIGPFLGIGLKSVDTVEDNLMIGVVALVIAGGIQCYIYLKENQNQYKDTEYLNSITNITSNDGADEMNNILKKDVQYKNREYLYMLLKEFCKCDTIFKQLGIKESNEEVIIDMADMLLKKMYNANSGSEFLNLLINLDAEYLYYNFIKKEISDNIENKGIMVIINGEIITNLV